MAMFQLVTWAQQAVSLDEVRQAGLHVIHITTVNGEEPQGKIIANPYAPTETFNYTYTNKVPCRIVITMGGDSLYDSGDYEEDAGGATIRINGNTTAYYSEPLNMPYKLKLEKSRDLLLRGDDQLYADKHWRLLKDAMSLNTITGLHLSRLIGMEWTAAYMPCNVVINGDYRGCYLLMETVRRNNRCRISTDKQTGFIVERDPYWWKEEKYFATSWYEQAISYRWTWKYPSEEDVTEETELAVSDCINSAEKAIKDGSYTEHLDTASFARWLLAHDILGTRDSGGSNMFIKKYDDTASSLLQMPCLWDFDSSFEMAAGSYSRLHTSANAYFSTLFQSNNKAFARAYVRLWNDIKDRLCTQLLSFIDNYSHSEEAMALDASRRLYNKRWAVAYPTVASDAHSVTAWLQSHLSLLDAAIQQIDTISTNEVIPIPVRNAEKQCYDLVGRRLTKGRQGLCIQKGKIYFVK